MADMETHKTFERVRSLIASSLDKKLDEIQPGSSFLGDLGADSLDIVELVMLIEREFDIEIPDDRAEKIETVGDAVEYVSSELKRLKRSADDL